MNRHRYTSEFSFPDTDFSILETTDLMKNKSLFEASTGENSFTLILSMIYSNSSKQYQLLYPRHDAFDWQLSLDVDSSKMSQPLKRTFLLDPVDE